MAMRGAAAAVLTIICCAVPSGASELDPDPSTSGTNCLWRVSSGSNEVYILGSVHLMQDDAEAPAQQAPQQLRRQVVAKDENHDRLVEI